MPRMTRITSCRARSIIKYMDILITLLSQQNAKSVRTIKMYQCGCNKVYTDNVVGATKALCHVCVTRQDIKAE
jgi:hypothetical protein